MGDGSEQNDCATAAGLEAYRLWRGRLELSELPKSLSEAAGSHAAPGFSGNGYYKRNDDKRQRVCQGEKMIGLS